MNNEILRDRFFGCLWGEAVGDAFGLGTEFLSKANVKAYYPQGFSHYAQIVEDHHRSKFEIGRWTDDTEMMIGIAQAIIEDKGEVNASTVAKFFRAWLEDDPRGIGQHTFLVIGHRDFSARPIEVARECWLDSGKKSAPNGAVMRTAVVGLLRDDTPTKEKVRKAAETAALVTHADPRCVGSAVIVSLIIHALVYENRKMSVEEILAIADQYDSRIAPFVRAAVANTDVASLKLDEQPGIGYTLRTLAAGLWAYFHVENFYQGLTDIVMQGGDADTNAAVACAILGAKYGKGAIPAYLIDEMLERQSYETLSEDLWRTLAPAAGR